MALDILRQRGYPWPESSWGMEARFGTDGWCAECGVTGGPQTGHLTLQARSVRPEGAWVPHWLLDVVCVDSRLAEELTRNFDVSLRKIAWNGRPRNDAYQIVPRVTQESWFSSQDLERALRVRKRRHEPEKCKQCGTWRWAALRPDELPLPDPQALIGQGDVLASREWFVSGMESYRTLLFSADLAGMLSEMAPRDFRVVEPGSEVVHHEPDARAIVEEAWRELDW